MYDIEENEYDSEYDFNDNERVVLDDPENVGIALDDTNFEDEFDVPSQEEIRKSTPLFVLSKELEKPEHNRGYIDFKYQGVMYQGVPMVKINENRFVFKLINHGDKLKAFNLSDISID